MTKDEAAKKLDKLHAQQYKQALEIVKLARGILPVLKDHQLTNVAEEFARALFEYDAVSQEMDALVQQNVHALLDALMDRLEGRG